jgi:sugar phosphate isomerase/epimerase
MPMNYTRREFGQMLAAGLAIPATLRGSIIDSKIGGVQLGVQTYSFHQITHGGPEAVDQIISEMKTMGLGMCELFSPDIEPFAMPGFAVAAWAHGVNAAVNPAAKVPAAQQAVRAAAATEKAKKRRDQLRRWRLTSPLGYFTSIAKKFFAAGVQIHSYNLSFDDSFSDEEIDRGFQMADALGTKIITASTSLSVAKRLVPFVEKHQMYLAVHGHSNTKDPNEFSGPQSFSAAMKMSKYFKVNLDIGHFWAAGFDPVAYIREQHSNITNLHIKDRLKNDGPNVPWSEGAGHTPIREVLLLLRREQWPIPAFIEYEYMGADTPPHEIAKGYSYLKRILAS